MATRFYLPSSGTAPLGSLAYDASWGRSEGFVRRPTDITKSNTALTDTSQTWAATATNDWVWYQFQSKRLAAGYSWTTSDAVSMVLGKCYEGENQTDTYLAYVVRVVSGDGSTVRGTVGVYQSTSTEFPLSASAATRIHDRTAGASNFSSQAGDRIIIEIGVYGVTPTATGVTLRVGDPTATSDFALTEGLTTDLCSWVELSRDVSFDVTSNRSAYTKGKADSSSNRAVYTIGGNPTYPANSNRAAYTKGRADLSNNRAVYTKGLDNAYSSRSVYTEGMVLTSSSNRSVFTLGIDSNILVPNGYVGSTGTWLNEAGSSSNLYLSIDETTPNDSDYIWNTDPSNTLYIEFPLSNPGGTVGAGNTVIFWRGRDRSGLSTQCTMQLRQGSSTVIASKDITLTTVARTYYCQLTAGEQANITDWSDLRLRIIIVV